MQYPSGHHDEQGNLTINGLDPDDPVTADFMQNLHAALPHEARDFDHPTAPSAVWIAWPHARRAVERLRATWPQARVTAEANPNYGRGDELAARLTEALAAIREAEDAIRHHQPAGVRR